MKPMPGMIWAAMRAASEDLGRDAGCVGGYARQTRREQSKHGRTKTDEHVGTKAGGTVVQLTLKADRSA
jgi:hypothetical protein